MFTTALMCAKAPSSHRGAEGDGDGCASSLFFAHSVQQILSLWSLCSFSPRSSRPQPLGSGGDVTPCEDTREDHGLLFNFDKQVLLQSVVFECRCEKGSKNPL